MSRHKPTRGLFRRIPLPHPPQESRTGFLWTILICLSASEAIKGTDSHGPGGICRPADAKHPGKPGSSTLDPIAERTNFSNSNFLLKSRERVDSHGPGGKMPPVGCRASGKTKKTPEEKACFLSRRFYVFTLPVAILVRFLTHHAEKSQLNLSLPSQTGVQRRNSSGAGVQGPRRPPPRRLPSFMRK